MTPTSEDGDMSLATESARAKSQDPTSVDKVSEFIADGARAKSQTPASISKVLKVTPKAPKTSKVPKVPKIAKDPRAPKVSKAANGTTNCEASTTPPVMSPLEEVPQLATTLLIDNSVAVATTIAQAPSTNASLALAIQPRIFTLPKTAVEPNDKSRPAIPVPNIHPRESSTGSPSVNGSPQAQVVVSFATSIPNPEIPLPSVEPGHPVTSFTTRKHQRTNSDVHILDAKPPSQPTIAPAPANVPTPDVDIQMQDAEHPIGELEIPATATPLGTPAPSVPDTSFRNRSIIYTSSGSVAAEPAPEYPKFPDGDVLIVSGTGRCWKLHSATLMKVSTILGEHIDGTEAQRSIKRHKQDAKSFRWKIHLVEWEQKPEETRLRSFKMVDANAKQHVSLPETMNGKGFKDPLYNRIYDNLFRCFYNLNPNFSNIVDGNIDSFIVDATSLLKAAEYIGAGPAVRVIVETNFLRLNQTLWKHIARNSAAWTDISLRLQSPTIFRAAMAHVVGRFDLRGRDGVDKDFLSSQPNGALLMDFAVKKAAELKDRKLWIERMLMEFYPLKMHHPETATKIPGRDAYGNDIYLWQAITLVRQYFASAMLSNMHHRASDGGTFFYQCVGQGGDRYLTRDVLEKFHDYFAMSTKGKECLRIAVAFMKEQMQSVVEPLLKDQSWINRHPDDPKPRYLTCSEILDDELPWLAGKTIYEADD